MLNSTDCFHSFTILIWLCYFVSQPTNAQEGSERIGLADLIHYEVSIKPNLYQERIAAEANLRFKCNGQLTDLNLLLSSKMEVSSIKTGNVRCLFKQSEQGLEVRLPKPWMNGSVHQLSITFAGRPSIANNPPWTGGFVWQLDHKDRTWLTTVPYRPSELSWLPYPANDAADSALIQLILPDRMMGVSNGTYQGSEKTDRKRQLRHTFRHSAPIYPAEIQLGAGYYQLIDTSFLVTDTQKIRVNHFVQDYNYAKAKIHLEQLADVHRAWWAILGTIPGLDSTSTLMETPFPGFGNRGLINYGNRFMRGSYGGLIPRGMNWDLELVRSTAEQYVLARLDYPIEQERWLKHGLITYLESAFVEQQYNEVRSRQYWEIYRPYLRNRQPLIDPLATDQELFEGEFQAKSGLLFHTIQSGLSNRFDWDRGLKTWISEHNSNGNEVNALIDMLNSFSSNNWTAVINHYLHQRQLPQLQLRIQKVTAKEMWQVEVKYADCIDGFNLPVHLSYLGNTFRVEPDTKNWVVVFSAKEVDLSKVGLLDPNILVDLVLIKQQ